MKLDGDMVYKHMSLDGEALVHRGHDELEEEHDVLVHKDHDELEEEEHDEQVHKDHDELDHQMNQIQIPQDHQTLLDHQTLVQSYQARQVQVNGDLHDDHQSQDHLKHEQFEWGHHPLVFHDLGQWGHEAERRDQYGESL
jgi:hypothetical protein